MKKCRRAELNLPERTGDMDVDESGVKATADTWVRLPFKKNSNGRWKDPYR